eukprot:scaffold149194_cov21-Tisochrysis_lutea.AAC.1
MPCRSPGRSEVNLPPNKVVPILLATHHHAPFIKYQYAQHWNFGWEYRNDCDVDLLDILDEMPKTREPVFYDAFLRTGPDTLYPVPVKVTNYDDSTSNNEDTGALTRSWEGILRHRLALGYMYQPTCALKNSVLLDLLPPDWANTATLLLDEVLSAVSSMWTGLW